MEALSPLERPRRRDGRFGAERGSRMTRHGAIGAGAVVTALLGGLLLYGYMQQPASAGPEYAQWAPSAAAIRGKIGDAKAPAPGMTESERREQFCMLFKSRYRDHNPAVA